MKHRTRRNGINEPWIKALIKDHIYMLGPIAWEIFGKLPLGTLELDELISMGYVGLTDAAQGYDPTREIEFAKFARGRVYGQIFDELRKMDFVSKDMRAFIKKYDCVSHELAQRFHREPLKSEIRAAMKVSPSVFLEMLRARELVFFSINSEGEENTPPSDVRRLALEQASIAVFEEDNRYRADEIAADRKDVITALSFLDQREREVILLHYFNDLDMRQIGRLHDRDGSRICQIKTVALRKIRRGFGVSVEASA